MRLGTGKFTDVVKNCEGAHTTAILVHLLVAVATVRTGMSTQHVTCFCSLLGPRCETKQGCSVSHHGQQGAGKVSPSGQTVSVT